MNEQHGPSNGQGCNHENNNSNNNNNQHASLQRHQNSIRHAFTQAANNVAQLFMTSLSAQQKSYGIGKLDCLEDILNLITEEKKKGAMNMATITIDQLEYILQKKVSETLKELQDCEEENLRFSRIFKNDTNNPNPSTNVPSFPNHEQSAPHNSSFSAGPQFSQPNFSGPDSFVPPNVQTNSPAYSNTSNNTHRNTTNFSSFPNTTSHNNAINNNHNNNNNNNNVNSNSNSNNNHNSNVNNNNNISNRTLVESSGSDNGSFQTPNTSTGQHVFTFMPHQGYPTLSGSFADFAKRSSSSMETEDCNWSTKKKGKIEFDDLSSPH